MADQFPQIMGIVEVADYLGVSRQYVDRLARAGKLRYKLASARMVFLKGDVVAFQEARMRKRRQPKKRRSRLRWSKMLAKTCITYSDEDLREGVIESKFDKLSS